MQVKTEVVEGTVEGERRESDEKVRKREPEKTAEVRVKQQVG